MTLEGGANSRDDSHDDDGSGGNVDDDDRCDESMDYGQPVEYWGEGEDEPKGGGVYTQIRFAARAYGESLL